MKHFLPIALVTVVSLVGCANDPKPTAEVPAAKFDPYAGIGHASPTNSGGLTLEEGRQASLKLRGGLTSAEVLALLGTPDETEAKTYGQNSDRGAWNGIAWNYRWPDRRLVIVFKHDDDAREHRIGNILLFERWAETNKAGTADYTAEQIADNLGALRKERLALVADQSRGLDYLVVNHWSWHDF